jgi:hypothetical protein
VASTDTTYPVCFYISKRVSVDLADQSYSIYEARKLGRAALPSSISLKRCIMGGDSIVQGNGIPSQTVSGMVQRYCNAASVINFAVGGTVLSTHADSNYDKLGLCALIEAAFAASFTAQDAAVAALILASQPDFSANVARAKTINLANTDAAILPIGTNDFGGSTAAPIGASSDVITMATGTPGQIYQPGHGMPANAAFTLSTTGAMLTGASSAAFVKTVIDADHFTTSATAGGSALNFSGTQNGVHTISTRATFCGAMTKVAKMLLTRNPAMRIFWITPTWRSRIAGAAGTEDVDYVPNSAGRYLYEYVDAMIATGKLLKTPVFDAYRFSGINKFNAANELPDGLHPALGEDAAEGRLARKWGAFVGAH